MSIAIIINELNMLLENKYERIFKKIRECAKISIELSAKDEKYIPGIKYLEDHFLFDLPLYRNLRIVKYLAKCLPESSKVLDWGCGYGDVSHMLKTLRADIDITPYDVLTSPPWDILVNKEGIRKIIGTEEIALPFENNLFDAVIGIGVLEHVKDQNGSLCEIHRVLKPQGKLYIFLYPNKSSYTERFQKIIGNPHHDRPLRLNELKKLLEASDFDLEDSKYELMMPFIMSRFPFASRHLYNYFGNLAMLLNNVLEKIPVLNKLSSNLTVIAQKKKESKTL